MWLIDGKQVNLEPTRSSVVGPVYNDVHSSSDGENWTEATQSPPWVGRPCDDIAIFDDSTWVNAGDTAASQGCSTEVWYSTDEANGLNLQGTPWVCRHAASAFVSNGVPWIGCGCLRGGL